MCVRYLTYRIRASVGSTGRKRVSVLLWKTRIFLHLACGESFVCEQEQNKTEGPFIHLTVTLLESFHLRLVCVSRLDCKRLVFGVLYAFVHTAELQTSQS